MNWTDFGYWKTDTYSAYIAISGENKDSLVKLELLDKYVVQKISVNGFLECIYRYDMLRQESTRSV